MESPIRKFYKEKSVFLTGATGFIGQILIEKLLRSCEIQNIYILIRNKKKLTWQERVEKMFNDELFDVLRKQNPDFKKQIIGIVGDCALPNLGISDADREELQQNVHIVFHCAATVNFEERLSTSIKINVRGTQGVIDLCKQMKDLQAFVHCSTAFSNLNRDVIEEKFYRARISGRLALEMLEKMDEETLDAICPELKGTFPNIYLFTKNLGEDLIQESCLELPAVVFRPSIVIATYKEPCAGWINNYYGPIGSMVGISKGILRVFRADQTVNAEVVPADFTINAMIASAWDIGSNKFQVIPIYNFVPHEENKPSWKKLMDDSVKYIKQQPSMTALWYYTFHVTKNPHFFVLLHFFHHILPAFFIDILLSLTKKKRRLLPMYKKILTIIRISDPLVSRKSTWKYENLTSLWDKMTPGDKNAFHFDMKAIDWSDVFSVTIQGVRYYLLKEKPDTIDAAKRKQKKLRILHYFVTISFKLLIFYLLYLLITFFIKLF